jgi:hypothetical protein
MEPGAFPGARIALVDRRLHKAGTMLLNSRREVYNFFLPWDSQYYLSKYYRFDAAGIGPRV